jgi:hypothetical protein
MEKYKRFFESAYNYNKLLTPEVKKHIEQSILAAYYEHGNIDVVVIESDGIIGKYIDRYIDTAEEYKKFDWDEAENFLEDTLEKMKKQFKIPVD